MAENPKIFISYSWTNPNHESWVINLAERLVSDGVDISIDKWDLKEGHDKFNFMETMVKSPDINKVLIILDKKYSEKADQRTGGVGTETQIISPNIYANVSQEKFIPIVSEKDGEGNPFIPTYLKGRIFIDLSDQKHYETNYESLLRNIYKRPAYNKPKIGKAPSYLFEETAMSHKTSTIIRSFDNQIEKNPNRINGITKDFLEEFYLNLKNYTVNFSSRDPVTFGKEICDNINSYTPLRNDFISFFDKAIKCEVEFDIDILIRFLERLPLLIFPQDGRSNSSSRDFDNFRFFIHELFLYLIAVCLKNENYKILEELFYSSYFFSNKYDSNNEPKRFEKFYNYVDVIDQYYNQAYSQNFFSPMADLMIKRLPEDYILENLIDADLLCYYIAEFNNLRWFPITYIYRTNGKFELFDRLISKRNFDKLKSLFDVSNPKELQDKLTAIQQINKNPDGIKYTGSFDYVTPIHKIIDIHNIATTR